MKKLFSLVLSLVAVFTFTCITACGSEESPEEETVNTVIVNEEVWRTAFENLDYSNYSLIQEINVGEGGKSYMDFTDDAVYIKFITQDTVLSEFYSLKKSDGTYVTYVYGQAIFEENTYEEWTVLNDNSETYLKKAKDLMNFDLSAYAEYYEFFTYNERSSTYDYYWPVGIPVCNDENEVMNNMSFYDTIITINNNKVTGLKMQAYEFSMTLEFTFGKTKVEVPEEVKNNAIHE